MQALTCVELVTPIWPIIFRCKLKSFAMQFPKVLIRILCCVH